MQLRVDRYAALLVPPQAVPRLRQCPASHRYCVPNWHKGAPSEYPCPLNEHTPVGGTLTSGAVNGASPYDLMPRGSARPISKTRPCSSKRISTRRPAYRDTSIPDGAI